MKKLLLLTMFVQLFIMCGENKEDTDDCDCSQYNQKATQMIKVCHNGETIEININALDAHLAHGDTEGPCSTLGIDEYEYDPCEDWCRKNSQKISSKSLSFSSTPPPNDDPIFCNLSPNRCDCMRVHRMDQDDDEQ